MGLLTEVLLREPSQRLAELTQAENPGGLNLVTGTGTVTVTSGSTSVVGAGTAFTALPPVPFVVQFSSQPGVDYVVASVQSDTALTLALAYRWVTTAGATFSLPSLNYGKLQQAVYDATQHLQERCNVSFDDTTSNQGATPAALNKFFWASVALVVAYLYDYRGLPMPGTEGEKAFSEADRRLKIVLNTLGDGAFSPPVTDSNYSPSYAPVNSLPDTDRARLGSVVPRDLGPRSSDGAGGSSPNDYNGGG